MNERLEMKQPRQATYTMTVPITFSFKTNAEIDTEKLFDLAEQVLSKCLANGTFDVNEKQIECIAKDVHYTKEDLQKERDLRKYLPF